MKSANQIVEQTLLKSCDTSVSRESLKNLLAEKNLLNDEELVKIKSYEYQSFKLPRFKDEDELSPLNDLREDTPGNGQRSKNRREMKLEDKKRSRSRPRFRTPAECLIGEDLLKSFNEKMLVKTGSKRGRKDSSPTNFKKEPAKKRISKQP